MVRRGGGEGTEMKGNKTNHIVSSFHCVNIKPLGKARNQHFHDDCEYLHFHFEFDMSLLESDIHLEYFL